MINLHNGKIQLVTLQLVLHIFVITLIGLFLHRTKLVAMEINYCLFMM